MEISKFLLAIMVALSMASCANHKEQQVVATSSEPEEEIITGLQESDPVRIKISVKGARPVSKSFSGVEVLALPDTCENFVGIPGYIKVSGDTLYIIDPVKSTGFYGYLHDGRQLFNYCSVGAGPEDFGRLSGLTVNDSLLSSFDFSSGNLVFVDKHGKFAKRIAVNPMACGSIEDMSGGIWTDYSNQEFETTRLSWRATPESEEIEILPVPDHLKGMMRVDMQTLCRLDDGTINYYPSLDTHIYGLSGGKAWLKYDLDFSGLWPDESTMRGEYGGDDWGVKAMTFPISNQRATENDDWLIISFVYQNDRYIHIYDKTEAKGVTYRDDRDIYYSPAAISGDKLYIPTKDDTIEIVDLASKK